MDAPDSSFAKLGAELLAIYGVKAYQANRVLAAME
jgi:hypothetical protein